MRKYLLFLSLVSGCQTVKAPEELPATEVEVETGKDEEKTREETPDEVFVREFDACWATYRACLDSHSGSRKEKDKICFPPQEECAIEAYRKLTKARGK